MQITTIIGIVLVSLIFLGLAGGMVGSAATEVVSDLNLYNQQLVDALDASTR